MNLFSDTSGEMEPNGLTSEAGEQLINGDTPSPEFSDLAAMLSELHTLPGAEPTPPVGAALSEFVGVGLAQTTSPAGLPEPRIDLTQPSSPMRETSRRKSVFAQIAAFAGTIGGKFVLGGTLAAASVTGAHAAGVVDVPGLPDKHASVETIDTELVDGQVEQADLPDALSFSDDEAESAEKEAAELEAKEKAETEAKKAQEAELEAAKKEQAEKAAAEKAAAEKAELEAKEKAELEAKKAQEAKEQVKPDEEIEIKLTDLEKTLNAEKAAIREEASGKITKLEAEKKELIAKRDDKVDAVNEQYQGWVNDILTEIEQAKSEEAKSEREAYLEIKHEHWDAAVEQTKAEFVEPIASIENKLEKIEIERDDAIAKLIEAFLEKADAIKTGK